MEIMEDLICMLEDILSILLVFGIPATMVVLLVWIKKKERMKRYELQADLYAKALEKGEKLPDDFFDRSYTLRIEKERKEQEKEKDELAELKRQSLFVGIILLIVGPAIALTMWVAAFFIGQIDLVREDVPMYIRAASAFGIIPFLIGIAFMIINFIGNKQRHD